MLFEEQSGVRARVALQSVFSSWPSAKKKQRQEVVLKPCMKNSLDKTVDPSYSRHQLGRILIVDDGVVQRHYLHRLLASRSSTIVQAENGLDGLKKIIADEAYDVILTDVDMPLLSGVEMVKALHGNTRNRVTVVAVSGSDDLISLSPHFDAVVPKPVTRRLIFDAIDKAMQKNRNNITKLSMSLGPPPPPPLSTLRAKEDKEKSPRLLLDEISLLDEEIIVGGHDPLPLPPPPPM